jgi:uncharacterized protein YndB with AHSA1/START domain
VTARSSATAAVLDPPLVISRVLPVTPGRLYEVWTRKAHVDRWLAPAGFTVLRNEADVRPGGRWHCALRGPDGTVFRVGGVYRQLVAPHFIVFTHAWEDVRGVPAHETTVTLALQAQGLGRTRMSFTQTAFASAADRDGQRTNWMECFDRLRIYLAGLDGQAQ